MSLAIEFLETFKKIEEALRDETKINRYRKFWEMVEESSNKAVKRYESELKAFGNLRNAISHNSKNIAEPYQATVDLINYIYNEIVNPIKVFPKFKKEIIGTKKEDFINGIFSKVYKESFSQFPVFNDNDEVIEIINTNTIARWLADSMEGNGTIILENVKIQDLLPYIEYRENYRFLPKNASIYDAYSTYFKNIEENKIYLDLIFITENGKKNQKLLGMITLEDITSHKI